MSSNNRIERVAIVGATGRVGGSFAKALAATGKHTVTALTRDGSKSAMPQGVTVKPVDYDDPSSIVSALQGQHFLIITLGVRAPPDLHSRIVQAALKAGIQYIMPNAYGHDVFNQKLATDLPNGTAYHKNCEEIRQGGASFIAMACGFWYDWSLALGEPWFGFDIKARKATFFDDGNTKISSSSWEQCGRALAALLSLPVSDASPSLSDWKNDALYIQSYRISQRDILDSLNRVQGTTDGDWEITYEPTAERYKRGLAELQGGKRTGFATAMYSRTFYPNGDADFSSKGLANEKLGMHEEDIDEATRRTVKKLESGWNPFEC